MLSQDDRKFLKKMEERIHQEHDGHYKMPLPFLEGALSLPNNRAIALHRLGKLRAWLKNDERSRQDYIAFMDDVTKKGYVEKVPDNELLDADGSVLHSPSQSISLQETDQDPHCVGLQFGIHRRVFK